MLYDIALTIGYDYDTPASGARHILRVLPLSIPGRQRLIAGSVKVSPEPDEKSSLTDFFGNPTTAIMYRSQHGTLEIRMQARVQVDQVEPVADFSPLVGKLQAELEAVWSMDGDSPHHLAGPSPRLADNVEIAAYARAMIKPGMTVREAAYEICKRVYTDFKYDPEATTVDSTPQEAFKMKRGVCQDFSHVMIVALRSLGIPAGYVSGFLRTIPPPGKERLEGADAMHAWVRVWCGESLGYIELDPTNNIVAGTDHIVVAYGRDYSDVAPVIGVLKSYGSHSTRQAVDVIPLKN
ncbi:transglutaminase family protein [Allorhizobium borbori]|uniref:Transglutaminase-like putative cysteine protease n=1 Tax=Allorhizobium borbori TaxID=485907 RepID=A0A7W6JYZ4_9HYPH|nr:transglutaminase family protein [Allorhizobium borbori]MBB4102103.1 transglutaminase-like putative cysteine protease [Allorhizobium borbori]PZU23260.1 MAG: transglutaminase [Shinella sp.]